MKLTNAAAIALTLTLGIPSVFAQADAPPVIEVEISDDTGAEQYRPAPGSPDYDPADYGATTATVSDLADIGPQPLIVARPALRLWLVGGVS